MAKKCGKKGKGKGKCCKQFISFTDLIRGNFRELKRNSL